MTPTPSGPLSRLGLNLNPPVPFDSGWGPLFWAVLVGIPVSIILLYFLKLRRKPLQVPSTFLWQRSIEDLHVNSLFQRLRRNLLLFLQLLAVFLVIMALLGPQVRGVTNVGQRYILAIDNSASMSATDVRPNRLEEAKRRALEIVDVMGPSDLAMVISFADTAEVVSSYTANTTQLRERIEAIRPARSTTSLLEALQVASGLANPSRQFGEGQVAGEVQPPKLIIYTDGGFSDVEGFSLGNLQPELVVIGEPAPGDTDPAAPPSNNLAVLAFQAAENEERPGMIQLFGRVHSYRTEDVATTARLFRHDPTEPIGDGRLIDAVEVEIPAGETSSFLFEINDPGVSGLEVRLDVEDDLELDDRAFAAIGRPRQAQVLVVTSGNRYLMNALTTATIGQAARIAEAPPDDLESAELSRALAAGQFDLVIFDRVAPEDHPASNTLYFGALPPGELREQAKRVEGPIILDWDIGHPMLSYIQDLSVVLAREALVVEEPPPGSQALIRTDRGTLAFVRPRQSYSDAVVGFSLFDENQEFNTDWHVKRSYPLFLYNTLRHLGNVRSSIAEEIHRPGAPIALRADPEVQRLRVLPPEGRAVEIERSSQGTFPYHNADRPGLYRVEWDGEIRTLFAVNLFDPRESDIAPRGLVPEDASAAEAERLSVRIGYERLQGTRERAPDRKEWWWALALAALGVLLVEWYIYNRRVYI